MTEDKTLLPEGIWWLEDDDGLITIHIDEDLFKREFDEELNLFLGYKRVKK